MRQTRNSAAGSKALAAGIALVAFTTFVAATAPAIAADWPCWRGRDGEGIWRGVSLPSRLTGDRVEKRWSVPIGGGYSGIAVVGSRVLTMDRPGKEVDEERVVCLDRDSGRTLWERRSAAKYGDLDHDNGPRATPTIDGGHVFAFGAVGRLACLELETGKPIWEVDVVGELNGKLPIWGHAASPVVRDGRVVVQAGARPGGTIVAFDRRTGKELWRARDDRPGYSTPITLRAGGIEQLVCWTADTVVALAPATGRAIWEMPFRTSNYDVAIISPVFHDGRLFVSGYWDGSRAYTLGDNGRPELLWESDRKPSCLMSTPLYREGHLYALDRRDGLLCVDWRTGKIVWSDEHRMTPAGRNPHASLVWAGDGGDRAIVLNAPGELIMARLSPAGYEELGRAPVIGFTWAHPAFSGQDVFARSDERIVCVRVRAGE